ncbi:DUF4148 domain-containing protein [Burkholderia ubonensis]|uniref:DUF4148 domain-containing protein n=1 Tax=Burkholderia ubonensis TaxID=101571 RepID=UPI0007589ABA|nr:DUF4148 domain-containing protein [Burkholderia ubonensis]KUZ98583.1 hypothetical protein WI40_01565 [Burkholderia ubonensis]KVA16588.1 hypothetical protein WI42_18180 [Burkholderia ubonensis]KVA33163.1 hypothetical protein WI43_27685 [Burkholderia ubonensis]KVA35293.1 hypothetical protein WI46_21730 [Burkholderia ubonensis]
MKSALSLLVAAAFAAPVASFAQSQPASDPVTRTEVVSQLQQLKQAGYKPSRNQYPADIQAAEARVAQTSGVGSEAGATGQSGTRVTPAHSPDMLISHH